MFPWPKGIPSRLFPALSLALSLGLPAMAREGLPTPAAAKTAEPAAFMAGEPLPGAATAAASRSPGSDPFLAAMLGALPLMSGFYLTSAPQKGAAFTLADAVLIGTIVKIRSDKNIPPKDAAVYYYLLGAVNVADLLLSVMQVRSDAAARLSVNLNPPNQPGFQLAWRF